MSLNDTSMHPTGAGDAVYPGVANPTRSSMPKESDSYAENATLSGHVPAEGDTSSKRDVIEGKPGVIESSELAPLGGEKVAADPQGQSSLVDQATNVAKQAYEAVVGEK